MAGLLLLGAPGNSFGAVAGSILSLVGPGLQSLPIYPDTVRPDTVERDSQPGVMEPILLDELVVTAARRPQRLKDAVVPTTVINRMAIESTGASDVGTVLTSQVGIEIDGGVPAGAGVRLQGLGGQRVLILIDGEPLTGRVNGNLDLSRIPASIVERIEVVEGPQSVLYGSAIGGVINIITRTPAERGFVGGADLLVGSRSRVEASGDLRGRVGRVGYTGMVGHRGVELAPGVADPRDSDTDRWDAHGSLRWNATSGLMINWGSLFVSERQRYRLGQHYRIADNEQLAQKLDATWIRGDHRLTPGVSYSYFDHLSRRSTSTTPVAGTGQQDRQELLKGSILYGGLLMGGVADIGLEYQRESILAERLTSRSKVLNTTESFLQMTWTLGDLSLTPGGRITWSDEWGRSLTPRLAALYRPSSMPELAIRSSIGSGFRAPDFKELYISLVHTEYGYEVYGNPDLQPEKSTNLAVSGEWSGSRLYSRVDLFRNAFRNFIESSRSGTSSRYSYDNIESGTISGVKLDLGYNWSRIQVEGGYAHLSSREAMTAGPLLGNPRHSWRLSLSGRPVDRARLNVTGQYTGSTPFDRDDNDGSVEVRAPFLRFDLRLTVDLPWSLEWGLGSENLLNRNPGPDWPGYTGRRFHTSISWNP